MNFQNWNQIEPGFFIIDEKKSINDTQALTNDAFSEKWQAYSEVEILEQEKLFKFQRRWFLDLYGFQDEKHLAEHLQRFEYILDAGCGLGYKAAWFAKLAPTSNTRMSFLIFFLQKAI